MYAALNSQSFMLVCVTSWMRVLLTYENMCIMLKIQLLHLQLGFITLKSTEELAALKVGHCAQCHKQLMQLLVVEAQGI